MQSLLLLCWQICLFRKGPQDIPSSVSLLWLIILVSLVLDSVAVNLGNPAYKGVNGLLAVMTYTGSLLILTAVLLCLTGYRQRVTQTLIAIFGSGIILTLIALPLILLIGGNIEEMNVWVLLVLLLELWKLFVLAHILHHAFSISLLLGLMMSFGYLLLGIQISDFFLNQVT